MSKAFLTLLFLLAITAFPVAAFAACTGPAGTAGEMVYNQNFFTFQYCDGTSWIRATPQSGSGSGGCASPAGSEGEIIYNEDEHVLQGCAGNTWISFGKNTSTWTSITTGRHTCGIKSNGTAWCWGDGNYGQLGNGATLDSQIPVQVNSAGTWKAVSASGMTNAGMACGIKSDDTAWCWGRGTFGALGNGDTVDSSVPVQVSGGNTWKAIGAGDLFACGIKSDGTLWCWGWATGGRLGNGVTTPNESSPVQVSGGGTWKALNVGNTHSCGIKSDDTLWCWGSGGNGALGNGDTIDQTAPVAVSGGDSWKAVNAGYSFTCGIKSDDTLWCWGTGTSGQLGNNDIVNQTTPVAVSGGATWKSVSAGSNVACGIKSDDTLWCWGSGWDLTDEHFGPDQSTPIQIASGTTWNAVSVGRMTCGIESNGLAQCWGWDMDGTAGNNATLEYRPYPAPVSGGYKWKVITGSETHWDYTSATCGIRTDGVAMCWGNNTLWSYPNTYSRLGNGGTGYIIPYPVTVSGGHTWTDINSGRLHTCGIRTDGVAMCWGGNFSGQIGDGTTTGAQVPTTVSGGHSWKQIAAGYNHSCGIRTDDVALCWGYNGSGQLGNGNTTNQSSPVTVNGGYTWKHISAGDYYTCGIRTDGAAMCWGSANNGRLGNGTTTPNQSSPVLVSGGYEWAQLEAGAGLACGVRTDGVGMCWGYDWNWSSNPTPFVLPDGYSWKALWPATRANEWVCGIRDDDTAWCIGENYDGNFGDGTFNSNYTNFVQVMGNTTWDSLGHGDAYTCGVDKGGNGFCWGWGGEGERGDGNAYYVGMPDDVHGCNDPAAEAGEIVYNADLGIMQYCNGIGWQALGKKP